jgi:hypothetical protein
MIALGIKNSIWEFSVMCFYPYSTVQNQSFKLQAYCHHSAQRQYLQNSVKKTEANDILEVHNNQQIQEASFMEAVHHLWSGHCRWNCRLA